MRRVQFRQAAFLRLIQIVFSPLPEQDGLNNRAKVMKKEAEGAAKRLHPGHHLLRMQGIVGKRPNYVQTLYFNKNT
jgi:hypothetical protein